MAAKNEIVETSWELSRLGKFTSSAGIAALMTEPRTKEAKARGDFSDKALTYIYSKAAEIITGQVRKVETPSMEWGNTWEAEAAEILIIKYPNLEYWGRDNPTFFPFDELSGGSPDAGIAEVDSGIIFEIKCPEAYENHVWYCQIKSGEELKTEVPTYYYQLQFNMLCYSKHLGIPFERMRGIFISYCPAVLPNYKTFHQVEISPDLEFEKKIKEILPRAQDKLASIIESMSVYPQSTE